jgi:hypothetical protein
VGAVRKQLGRLSALDVLLVIVLLAVPVWSLAAAHRAAAGRAAAYISHENRLVGVYPLDQDQIIRISHDHSNDVVVEIKAGQVRVAESDCSKGVCKHAGWVKTPGRSIVCLPNRVVVEIRGQNDEYDVESY